MSTPISSTGSSTTPTVDSSLQTAANDRAAVQALLQNQQQGPTISFGGLVSGLSTQALIQALMSAEQAPVLQMEAQQAQEQGRLTAFQDLNSKLQTLQAAASALSLASSTVAKNVTFAGPSGTFATGTASADALAGNFSLQIDQLATPTSVSSASGAGNPITTADAVAAGNKTTPAITTGTFTVNGVPITIVNSDTYGTLFAKIHTATGNAVSASIVGNEIQLSSNSPITVGSGSDTSNFLAVAKLAAQPDVNTGGVHTITSGGPVGVVDPTAVLNSANIAGLTPNVSGSLVINGVTINYNTSKDALTDVINRINASAAGVNASYDPNSDTVTLTSSKTGNVDISVSDGSGNLVSSLSLTNHMLGLSAKYHVNGGAAQYSLSNTVQNMVPGVNVTLQAVTSSPITANVAIDSSVGTTAIQSFVTAYNSVVDTISQTTSYDSTTRTAGIFLGDATVEEVQSQLQNAIFIANGGSLGLTSGFTDLSAIGLTTGAVGSAPGTTTDLQFDASKFQAALTQNPNAVQNLVSTVFKGASNTLLKMSGPFGLVDNAIQSETTRISDFQLQINEQNLLLQQKQQTLNTQFTNLETTLAQLQASSASGSSALAGLSSTAAASTAVTSSAG